MRAKQRDLSITLDLRTEPKTKLACYKLLKQGAVAKVQTKTI